MTISTTAPDVVRHFAVTGRGQQIYDAWRADPRRRVVVDYVMSHRAEAVYRFTPDDVQRVCEATSRPGGHALGDVKGDLAKSLRSAEGEGPAFAFAHVFHYALEQAGRIPTWPEFVRFIHADPLAKIMFGKPVQEMERVATQECGDHRLAMDAVQWRVGNFYYSAIRELHVLTHLRQIGLDVQVHPLADALFRVDAWLGPTILSLYVGNAEYRDGALGRKVDVRELLGGSDSGFTFETIRLPRATAFGRVHLAPVEAIQNVARCLARQAAVERDVRRGTA